MNIYKTGLFKYLSGEMFVDKEVKLTIKHCAIEDIEGHKGRTESKPVLYFRESDLGLVLNKTNAKELVGITGTSETKDWAGNHIVLYTERLQAFGEWHNAIRVKATPSSLIEGDELSEAAAHNVDVMRGLEDEPGIGDDPMPEQMALAPEPDPTASNYEEGS